MSDTIPLKINSRLSVPIKVAVNRVIRENPTLPPEQITSDGSSLTYNQLQAQSVWEISHPFTHPPVVVIIDSAGSQVYGSVEYLTPSQVRVSFSAPFSGKAILS